MTIDARVLDHIIACDTRYRGHKPDGSVVLVDDDGSSLEMTPAEYLNDHQIGLDEELFATIDVFLSDIKGTSITTTSSVVDVLLDLRRIFQRYSAEQHTAVKTLMEMAFRNRDDE